MNLSLKRTGLLCAVAYTAAITSLPVLAAPKKSGIAPETSLEALDSRFHQTSIHLYTKLARSDAYPKADSIKALAESVDRLRSQNQQIDAVATVMRNIVLVEKNIDTTPIISICGLLLETNEWNTASELYKRLKKQGDKSLVSNVSLSMAKYHFARNEWKDTIGIVESARSDLPPEDYNHALLIQGIALQHLQKHRVALAQYGKIPKTSRYYAAARLNMAVANIRQDWWTDAHIIINDLLKDKTHASNDALTDRLYTVLGYSFLQQQYYRNSREAFRNVSLDGQYTNKALLGIALTAAYQDDYVGALNAIRILKDKKAGDLPVDEANLLQPYFYEKLQQLTTANAGYAEAILYYEKRTSSIKDAMQVSQDDINKQLLAGSSNSVTINGEVVDLGEKLPKFVFDNVRLLSLFEPHIRKMGDAPLQREYNALCADYNMTLKNAAQSVLDEKSAHITHYMNQSRYGLARMQDNDTATPK
jgi:hypothetical protein